MEKDHSLRGIAQALISAAAVTLLISAPAAAETRYAGPDGRAGNAGSRSAPWNAASCFERLSPGDTCIYLNGNYGGQNFEPLNSGSPGNRINHECESLHGCRFDRIKFEGVSHVNVAKIASDTNYYDDSKSFTNPRMGLFAAHHLRFDSIYVRGEPQACADGNPVQGCKGGSEYSRYNDLVRIGDPKDGSKTSWAIEITGRTELIDGNHSVVQIYDDNDAQYCETRESDIWIHGTPERPIKMSSKYHHIISLKGSCRVLVEHVDFGPAGTGRGDRYQPDNSTFDQAGGILHTSGAHEFIVRYSNFSKGGSGTRGARNNSHIEVGMFGDTVNGACFAHNSHFRPWGTMATIGRLNKVRSLQRVSILNNALSEPWHMRATNRSAADSPYAGYAIARTGQEGFVQVDVDGIAVGGSDVELFTSLKGRERRFTDSVSYIDGVQFGSGLWSTSGALFRQPTRWDFRPRAGSVLLGNAVPIATTTSAGSGKDVPVSRPECFAGTMSGMRSGDTIDIGGTSCTVKSVDLGDATLTCQRAISWENNAPIFYKSGNRTVRDIGSRVVSDGVTLTDAGDDTPPKAPSLAIQQ